MAKLPKRSIVDRIDAVDITSYPRPHLGASIIGNPCRRQTVYTFYWAFKQVVPARIERIFRMGDDIEERIIQALESIGIKHYGSQQRVSDPTGHGGGSIDGLLALVPGFDEPLLFEGKSMNHTNFLNLKKRGVQESKPTHYVQMQMYMGRLDPAVRFALYVAMNKNTCELYTEFVPFDADCFYEHLDFEADVLNMKHINEFPRISDMPTWFHCKTCPAKDICHKDEPVEQNCRTCKKSVLRLNGQWLCLHYDDYLTVKQQEEGCGHYELSEAWQ